MAKYDYGAEAEVREWIQSVTGDEIPEGPENVYKELKSGAILVK